MSVFSQQEKDELLSCLQEVLRFDTVRSEPKLHKPFGEGNFQCLQFVLEKAQEMGFSTFNCDNFAGHIDFGQGEVFGVLGHLDVVPVTTGWKAPPFSAEIVDGFLYGRGTLDNKGPMIAVLFALNKLKNENKVPTKTIRIILGCDEESGWGCMDYYRTKVEMPTIGFSPDGDFPVINVEKGVYHPVVSLGAIDSRILEISAGSRINVVPDLCTAKVTDVLVDHDTLEKLGVFAHADGNTTTLIAHGKSTHGSNPQNGDNAAWKIFSALKHLFPDDKTVEFVSDKICSDFNGKGWGIFIEDEPSGLLTTNVGTVKLEDNELKLGIDLRFPVTFTRGFLIDLMKRKSIDAFKILGGNFHDPLYVEKDAPLVQTLLSVYQRITGKKPFTIAVGGATYARALPMGVAFGPIFPGGEKVIHEIDERISLDHLFTIAEIYYEALKELCFES